MKIAKRLSVLCLAVLLLVLLVACGETSELTLSADKTTAQRGDVVTLTTILKTGDEESTPTDVTFEITEGATGATLDGNKLTVSATAASGAIIKVKATSGELTSNEITVTVSVPLTALTAGATAEGELARGTSVILQKTLTPADCGATVTWVFVEGNTAASIAGDVLVVNQNAVAGTVIKVKAVSGSIESNVLTFTVAAAKQGLILSADKTTALRGDVVTLATVLKKDDQESIPTDVTFAITEGAAYATLDGNKLTVNATAAANAVIKVKAISGELVSNEITVAVSVPLTAISATTAEGELARGTSVILQKTLTPIDCGATVTWVLVEGNTAASIAGDVLVVNQNAATGTVIKVKAVSGNIESNVLTFTVAATQEEINASRYFISFDEDSITFDKNGLVAPILNVSVFNYNLEEVTGLTIDYEILTGGEFVAITPNGYTCTLAALGHGQATVRATIRGTEVSQTATVNVIVPPSAINLPAVFRERPGYMYNVSMQNPATGAAYTLPFVPTVVGTGVCTDFIVSFTHKDGSTGATVATYDNGSIQFLKEGEVTVTVTSNSGSRYETSVSYKFNINRGYNVTTFEELSALANDPTYTGSTPINLVVTEKPVGATSYEYDFDLVPATALKAPGEQLFVDIIDINKSSIRFLNKGVIINGNQHKIDASQLRIPTSEEISGYTAQGGSWNDHAALFAVEPWAAAQTAIATYRVELYDFEVKGNCPITLDANTAKPAGVYRRGIIIGSLSETAPANYYLTMQNVNATACHVGIRLLHVVDGRVDNAFVNDCFSNGFEIGASILTLNNITYGACGATGIELVADHSNMAGVNRNQNQQITYSGKVSVEFRNNNQTEYLENYKINLAGTQMTIAQILAACFEANGMQPGQLAHFLNENNEIVYVTFMFHDLEKGTPNTSEIIYPGFQGAGIINAKDLPADGNFDTTHEYIEFDVAIAGVGNAGKAYFYNYKYQPAN